MLSKVAEPLEAFKKEDDAIAIPEKEATNEEEIQGDIATNESPIVVADQLAPEIVELSDDPTLSYSDTSYDGGGLPPPSNGMVTNPRR